MRLKLLIISLLTSFLFAACSKDEEITFDTNAKISFSTDSVLFDTVFTSIGSSSRRLKITNPNESAIILSNIKLSGGNSSAFSLNINGQAVSETNNLKLNGSDSINVFVKVNINPTAESLPFVVQDSILFYFNGQKRSIPLVAYGQNANFVKDITLATNTTWDSKLPYIIYNSLTVAENTTLNIVAGTKVLFHGNSTMSVRGTLKVTGTKTDTVLFTSDRLEKLYANETGQWNGIHLYPESKNSTINYAIIKNATAGITVDGRSSNTDPKLLLTNTIIKNMEVVGLLGYETDVAAFNNLFFNCGQYLLYGAGGGSYNLKQNTFAGYQDNKFARKTAAVYLSDFISTTQASNLNLQLANNIIYGALADEFTIDKKSALTTLTINLRNNVIKNSKIIYADNLMNVNPSFLNTENYNFGLSNNSAVAKKGINLTADSYFSSFLNKDLKNNSRVFPSALGCYEVN